MNPFTSLAIYVTLWWVVLFAVLPLGARSHHEAGQAVPGGGDPTSPVVPDLKRKLITTTWVSAVLFGMVLVALRLFWPAAQPV